MKVCAVILGGGSGSRMGAKQNKIFLPLRGVPAIVRAAAPFTGLCAEAVVVARPEERDEMTALLRRYGLDSFVKKVVPGGSTRQDAGRRRHANRHIAHAFAFCKVSQHYVDTLRRNGRADRTGGRTGRHGWNLRGCVFIVT